MSHLFSLQQLSKIVDHQSVNLPNFLAEKLMTGISTDSRHLQEGEVFIALKGENFDGHHFVQQALEKGAIALILDHAVSAVSPNEIPQFIVPDTLGAYQQIAQYWRSQLSAPIIGITGSVGKTTTKELLAGVLGVYGAVHKTDGNDNNEIGVPKTLLGLKPEHDYGIIEMAMRGRGEIALLSQIAQPDIGLITNVGTAHIGRLGSREAIAEAKCELLAEMPKNSVAILNYENPLLLSTAAQVWSGETLTYGLDGGDITGEITETGQLRVEGLEFPLPLPGRHNALNYLAALAVTKVLNLDWTPLTQGVTVTLPKGRSQRYDLRGDVVILDETYNAGLESMIAALQLLKETPGKRHIAVLGTMKELGAQSAELHEKVGETVKNLGIDLLFVLTDDPEAGAIAVGAKGVKTVCFPTPAGILQSLTERVQEGDRLLFKASNSVNLGQVVQKFRDAWNFPD